MKKPIVYLPHDNGVYLALSDQLEAMGCEVSVLDAKDEVLGVIAKELVKTRSTANQTFLSVASLGHDVRSLKKWLVITSLVAAAVFGCIAGYFLPRIITGSVASSQGRHHQEYPVSQLQSQPSQPAFAFPLFSAPTHSRRESTEQSPGPALLATVKAHVWSFSQAHQCPSTQHSLCSSIYGNHQVFPEFEYGLDHSSYPESLAGE